MDIKHMNYYIQFMQKEKNIAKVFLDIKKKLLYSMVCLGRNNIC